MTKKLYKRIILIPANSEEEAEKKFQLLLKGLPDKTQNTSSWMPLIEAFAQGATKSILENMKTKYPLKK